jgi:hypothetical protein
MLDVLFWAAFAAVGACIAFAIISPWVSPKWAARIKPVWGWVQRNMKFVAIAVATLAAMFFASRATSYRRKQSKEIQKSREKQHEDLAEAELHRAEAKAAAAKASAVIERGKYTVEKIINEPAITADERVARINQRLRDASRAADRAE